MTDSSSQASEIRQFLLGQLPYARAEQLEERIFANPDFGEEVDNVERELIDDYLAGRLAHREREPFEQKYLKNAAGQGEVEYEDAFTEFLRTRRRGGVPLREEKSGQAESPPLEAGASLPSDEPAGPSTRKGQPWLGRLFKAGPAPFKLKIAAGLLIVLGLGLLLLSPRFLPRPDSGSPERRAWEAELARLNADAAAAAYIETRVSVDLKPMQRGGGAVPRLSTGELNQNSLIKLRLHLKQNGPTRYRAVFLGEQRHELLAVPNLTGRNTPDGPQLWLLVPSKYFRPGDYQISLRAINADGSEEEVNSYTLRVVESM